MQRSFATVIPKPPFAGDLREDEEIARFDELKGQLRALWSAVFPRDDAAYTSVVVPSIAGGREPWSSFLEERLLFLLIRLRNPRARLVYVTSQPIHPIVVEYYLQMLAGIPASHARARTTLLCAHDHSPRPLTEKILERPRLLQRVRAGIEDRMRAYLTVCDASVLERRLAVLLGIPMNALDPRLDFLQSPHGSRAVFEEAGVEAVPPEAGVPDAAPSVELRINPHGETSVSSTHEHERPAPGRRAACRFPADEAYRGALREAGLRVGAVLAGKGATSRCSLEFGAWREGPRWRLRASALRLGMGEATHPMLALRFLTGGRLDQGSGLFVSPRGQPKFYRASDDVQSDAYRGLLPEDLVEILTFDRLSFSQRSETGVLFHMIGAVSQFGRVGLVAIGNSPTEADALFDRTLRTLDHETRYGR